MDRTTYNRKKRQFKEMQLVGVSDIAKIMGWTNSKTSLYYQRGKLPAPIGEVGGRPVWLKDSILPYVSEYKTND
jgi:hypothetical protein